MVVRLIQLVREEVINVCVHILSNDLNFSVAIKAPSFLIAIECTATARNRLSSFARVKGEYFTYLVIVLNNQMVGRNPDIPSSFNQSPTGLYFLSDVRALVSLGQKAEFIGDSNPPGGPPLINKELLQYGGGANNMECINDVLETIGQGCIYQFLLIVVRVES